MLITRLHYNEAERECNRLNLCCKTFIDNNASLM